MPYKITTLLGGARITLDGYVISKICSQCQQRRDAAEFLTSWRMNPGIVLSFGTNCGFCSPPERPFPSEIRAARFTATYCDELGRVVGWRERTRNGEMGVERSLTQLQVRVVDGITRPQPKLNRKKGVTEPSSRPGDLLDSRRNFLRAITLEQRERQGRICSVCDQYLEEADTTADHIKSFATGGATDIVNCQAVHSWCNSTKGKNLSTAEAKRRMKAKRESKIPSLWSTIKKI